MSQTEDIQATVDPAADSVADESLNGADASGPARLVLKRNGVETEEVFLFTAPAIVGRFDPSTGPIDIDLGSLPEGGYISRKHAKISWENGEFLVTDLGSSNGTYVYRAADADFERVESAVLTNGDEVAFGNARFIFHAS